MACNLVWGKNRRSEVIVNKTKRVIMDIKMISLPFFLLTKPFVILAPGCSVRGRTCMAASESTTVFRERGEEGEVGGTRLEGS